MRRILLRSVVSCALAGAITPLSALAQSPPSPDRPKLFVWAEGLPCGVVPTSSDFLVAMPKLYLGVDWTGPQAANAVADYVYEHTHYGPWHPLNDSTNNSCHSAPTNHLPDLYSTNDHPDDNNICVSTQRLGA